MQILKLSHYPQYLEQAAQWFSSKWGIPIESYQESIQASIEQPNYIPQWYIVLDEQQNVIAGTGIIENDFHDRKDLTPNLCALFVEETYRNKNLARQLLDFARKDVGKMNYEKLYLVTDHTTLYEKCGWAFLTMVQEDEGELIRMYVADAI